MDAPRINPSGNGGVSENPAPAAPAKASSGLSTWLPLIVTLLAMPVLAYGMMTFVLMPKLQQAVANPGPAPTEPSKASGEKNSGKHGAPSSGKMSVSLDKIIVNVAGTMGTRYLMTKITLVGTTSDFENLIKDNKDQLLDLASSTLRGKTINDLEKPGAVNQLRTELLSIINNALGANLVKEVYIPELAIQ